MPLDLERFAETETLGVLFREKSDGVVLDG